MNPLARIAIFCLSVWALVVSVYNLVFDPKPELDGPAHWFVCCFIGVCGATGIWLLFRRADNAEEGPESSVASEDDPHSLVCVFQSLNRSLKRVTVHRDQKTVRFENCHARQGFLAPQQSVFICPWDQILGIELESDRSLTIVTDSGKAVISPGATNLQLLTDALRDISESTPSIPLRRSNAYSSACVAFALFGALAGLFVGWGVTPPAASNFAFQTWILCGSFFGAGAGLLASQLSARWFGLLPTIAAGFVLSGLGKAFPVGMLFAFFLNASLGWHSAVILSISVVMWLIAGFGMAKLSWDGRSRPRPARS